MKVKAIFIVAFCLLATNIQAQENHAFKAGERLQYDVFFNWGFIWLTAARFDFTVQNTTYNKTPAYRLQMAGRTARAFSMFTFTDTTKVYVNRKTLEPYFFRQASHEPDFFNIHRLTYFSNDTAKWGVFVENERSRREIKHDTVTSNKTAYYDVLTTLYSLRNVNTDDWKVNHRITMPMIFGKDTLSLQLRFMGREQIKLRNGKTYNALKMRSALADGKMFDKNEEMTLWISDDKNNIPLMVETKLKVGSIRAQLSNAENTVHPIAEVPKKK